MPRSASGHTISEHRHRASNALPSVNARAGRPLKNSELIHADLREAMVSMALTPGTRISEKDLAARYGVSRTPVREAILRLSDERLVEVVQKSGTYVSRIPLSTLREAMAARKALESVTVRAAAETASESQIMWLRSIIRNQQETAADGDEDAFHQSDEDFHAALATVGGYPGIWDLVQQVKIHVDRYRRLTLPQPGRMESVIKEHKDVVAAIADHDVEAAAARMEQHLNRLKLDIAVLRDMWPSYFIYDIEISGDTSKSA